MGHHDEAYLWAERRKLEAHPRTGAAQLVEVREEVEVVIVPKYVEVEQPAPPKPQLFAHVSDDEILGYGVPAEWLADVRLADEDSLLVLAEHLPAEAAEALLDLATGVTPAAPQPVAVGASPFEHPDAQRRFRLLTNVEELERALEYPWEKWTIFLHPSQRELVERDYNGPARVSGSAGTGTGTGTGKTIVALHRAVYLARANRDARVLLATFSGALANVLRTKLWRLISNEPRLGERLEVHTLDALAARLFQSRARNRRIVDNAEVREIVDAAAAAVGGHKFSANFVLAEWTQVVDAWQLRSWEAYRDVSRLGRKTRLPEGQRAVLWQIFESVQAQMEERKMVTRAGVFSELAAAFTAGAEPPIEFAIVDEAQDLSVAQLRFLAAIGGERPNGLFFAGDLGQRIFQQPFSWKALGVDVRGRSRTLRINYRTSHQIRMQADRLLGPELSDVDGNLEVRRGTVSVFNGPAPVIVSAGDSIEECAMVGQWLMERLADGVHPDEMAIFVRSEAELGRAQDAASAAGLGATVLDEDISTVPGQVSLSTMHLAKGLEFRAVAVMACDDDVIPSPGRIEMVADEAELLDVYNTERQLLYVACTRARDHLLVTSGGSPSEFLADLEG